MGEELECICVPSDTPSGFSVCGVVCPVHWQQAADRLGVQNVALLNSLATAILALENLTDRLDSLNDAFKERERNNK